MPSNYTPNYHLNQWEPEDKVLRTDFNADNAKIDAALAALATADTTESAARKALEDTLNQKGNCRVYTTSYTGNGNSGSTHPTSISLPGTPLFIAVTGDQYLLIGVNGGSYGFLVQNSQTGCVPMSWYGSTVRWYSSHDNLQLNIANVRYTVVALIDAGE